MKWREEEESGKSDEGNCSVKFLLSGDAKVLSWFLGYFWDKVSFGDKNTQYVIFGRRQKQGDLRGRRTDFTHLVKSGASRRTERTFLMSGKFTDKLVTDRKHWESDFSSYGTFNG